MFKKVSALILSIVLIFIVATPAFAQPIMFFEEDEVRTPATGSLAHSAGYELDGSIDFKKQAGHFCNTGAEMKQTILGDGMISKDMTLFMIGGKIDLSDSNDFVASADSLQGLAVTSVIELCAPPKSVFTEKGAFYASLVALFNELLYGSLENGLEIEPNTEFIGFPKYGEDQAVPPLWHYLDQLHPGSSEKMFLDIMALLGLVINPDAIEYIVENFDEDDFNDIFDWLNSINKADPLTNQIWAASVAADPGRAGQLSQEFTAANGPWGGVYVPFGEMIPNVPEQYREDLNIYFFGDGQDDTFWFDFEEYPDYRVDRGPDYVGSYFNIEQDAYTDGGTMKRYIDISSPWNHGYLHEDMTVTGRSSVEEVFSMENLEPGSDMPADWWKLF